MTGIIEKIQKLRDQALQLKDVGLDSKFYQGRADGLDEALSILIKIEDKRTDVTSRQKESKDA